MSVSDIFYLLGGISLFLFGMNIMSTGLRNACGDHLQTILEKATRNKPTSVLAGIAVTVLVQSSSATDVMVIGFVSSGLMTLAQAIGVIMGANIGTTITAQITAFNIGKYAPVILFVGMVMYLFIKHKTIQNIGSVIMGFGMLFLGVSMMKSVIAPLADTPEFMDAVSKLSNPFVTVIFGVLFTALLQSSSSSTVIFQAFALQGLISYQTAVYLLIGAALGAVTPNLLAGLTANKSGRRCSILNLVFNLLRAILMMIIITLIPQLLSFLQSLSPNDVARQIANTHTAFAIISVCILLPFSSLIVKLTKLIIPFSKAETKLSEERKLVYLTQTGKVPPALAVEQAHKEITRLGHIAIDNLHLATECFFTCDRKLREEVLATEENVDYLTKAIVAKLLEIRSLDLSTKNMNKLYNMIQTVDDMERISDHAENIVEYEELFESGKAKLSETAMTELKALTDLSASSLNLSLEIFESENFDRLKEVRDIEDSVDNLQEEILNNHVERLMAGGCDPQGGLVFADMAIDLERCSDHALNIAEALCTKDLLPKES